MNNILQVLYIILNNLKSTESIFLLIYPMNINNDIDILPVSKDNLSEVIDILQSVSEYNPPYETALEKWNEFLNQANYFSLVAILNGKVVGYGSIFFIVKIRGGKMGQIDEIAIRKEYRGIGIGKLIMHKLYEFALKQKCYKISLTCKENNIKFYENQSFAIEGFHLNRFF